ncbi:glutamate mutase L [Kineosporia sp. J2-2]|uniref:Glutamate mutase L n=1 Tax=Kineosporia corallincola TaxID=2835133 RepID=A0ABS5THC7_9ACTN|nr:glutamate mutase L [Kineosporia corallincola]MBT0770495.1 glutamate mutase L [Kineosporia corallincola]
MPQLVLCVDVGSTYTKAVLVDASDGGVLGTAQHPTTRPDVMAGIAAVREELAAPDPRHVHAAEILACSSAGGGLRLAVVGHERLVTAEAGRRAALSAGGRVVHLSSGPLTPDGVRALRDDRPDLIVLTGGTDGGNADVVVHNARRLGVARLPVPVVVACNQDASAEVEAQLRRRGRAVSVTDNLLPSIGTYRPGPAREAVRAAFLEHVIGGKGLSRSGSRIAGRSFRQLVVAPTPDAVLSGVEALAAGRGLLLADVGGATTDVYSALPDPAHDPEHGPQGKTTGATGDWLCARTVEGDLGVRSGAAGVVEAALAEGLLEEEDAARLRARVGSPSARPAQHLDLTLARLAVLIAVRRHGRAPHPGALPRPLREVVTVVGSGGVLRHCGGAERDDVLKQLLADHAGGWAVPEQATLAVDARYTLFAAGLLSGRADPAVVRRLATAGLQPVAPG